MSIPVEIPCYLYHDWLILYPISLLACKQSRNTWKRSGCFSMRILALPSMIIGNCNILYYIVLEKLIPFPRHYFKKYKIKYNEQNTQRKKVTIKNPLYIPFYCWNDTQPSGQRNIRTDDVSLSPYLRMYLYISTHVLTAEISFTNTANCSFVFTLFGNRLISGSASTFNYGDSLISIFIIVEVRIIIWYRHSCMWAGGSQTQNGEF